jgi:deoxyadenosine/deoxycytidine kinase
MSERKQGYIAIAGNIGAGKTELTSFLCDRYGLNPFVEPNEANPYLADFYAGMHKWAFQSQLWFLVHKYRLLLEFDGAPRRVVQDRTLYEDAEIFARNLYRQRAIDKRDFATYWALYETIVQTVRPPDLMIQLRCAVRTLRKRIERRGRTIERGIPVDYLRRLNRLYEQWFARYDLSPVIVLETDRLDWMTDLVDQLEVFRKIERFL